jgi:uncharacterized protein
MPREPTVAVPVTTSDGVALEADAHRPALARAVATIAHPHPHFGGTMDHPVVGAFVDALAALDVAALRFNFRGVGRSAGSSEGGSAERLDLLGALDAAAALAAGVPLVVCGYSFGADVALTCDHERAAAWIVVAPPLRLFPADAFVAGRDERPVHLIVPAHDTFAPPDAVREHTASWPAATVHVVESADHFLVGSAGAVRDLIAAVASDVLSR